MSRRQIVTDLILTPIVGYIATKGDGAGEHEALRAGIRGRPPARRRGSPWAPYRIAAEKTAGLFGATLTDAQLDKASLAFHYGLAISWAPLYPVLRYQARLSPAAAGLGIGAAMSLLADELLTPALGFSAPNRSYPLATHARGVVAHLAFGLGVAATFEAAWALLGRLPREVE